MTDHEYIDRACWSAECEIKDIASAVKGNPSLSAHAAIQMNRLAVKLRDAIEDVRTQLEKIAHGA